MFAAYIFMTQVLGQQSIVEGGCLRPILPDGKMALTLPLKATNVDAEISGMGVRVTMRQSFVNDTKEPIEAVYTFPLPADGAVDRMRMQIGDRVIEGEIKRKEEARAIYENAKRQGMTASLLDQERPNIFTQSVANIMPGAKVDVEISYTHLVKYEDGQFEFSFPMVVGPRFIPETTPDRDKVTPPVLPPSVRSGNNISLRVKLAAGAPIQSVNSVLHAVGTKKIGESGMEVNLSRKDEIPNRDFVLRWQTTGDGVQESVLSHYDKGEGTFCVILRPPKREQVDMIQPKEVIFVMDQSGSQSGFPLEKSKELTLKLLPALHPDDTFNVISFANKPVLLWPEPKRASAETMEEANNFVRGLQANGGTMFAPAIEAALSSKPAAGRLRLVVFNTDGFVGNDFEVLSLVQKFRDHGRLFTFGIGNGVNRFLIDAMSVEGRGDSEIVMLAEGADLAAQRFIDRTRSPMLTDIELKASGVRVTDLTPENVPDVFSTRPIVVMGRYSRPGRVKLELSGRLGGAPWARTIEVDLSAKPDAPSLTSLWARRKVDDLMREDWMALQSPAANATERRTESSLKDQIIALALKHSIMTQYTSFVAVEKKIVNIGGKQRTVAVPVDLPDGVAPEMADRVLFGYPASGGFGGAGGRAASGIEKRRSTEGYGVSPVTKISTKLAAVKGEVEVQIRVSAITPQLKEELKKLGFKLDDDDGKLNVLFGRVDAAKLKEIEKIAVVLAIDPL